MTATGRHGRIVAWALAAWLCAATATAAGPPAGPAVILAPDTPTSVPLVLAAGRMPAVALELFTLHDRAHARFLTREVPLLVTGLSVGLRFFRQGAPVQLVNAYVAGLTHLMVRRPIRCLADLKDQSLALPFAGSPIDEVTGFFFRERGLVWPEALTVIYTPLPSALALLCQGRVAAAALPEPYASLAARTPGIVRADSYLALWRAATGEPSGYPQVGIFVFKDWADRHPALIHELNTRLAAAIETVAADPAGAVRQTANRFPLPADIQASALRHTVFAPVTGPALPPFVTAYYARVGLPLRAGDDAFFRVDSQ